MILLSATDMALASEVIADIIADHGIAINANAELVKIANAVHKAVMSGLNSVAYRFTASVLRNDNWEKVKELINAELDEAEYTYEAILDNANRLIGYDIHWDEEIINEPEDGEGGDTPTPEGNDELDSEPEDDDGQEPEGNGSEDSEENSVE